MDDGVKRSKTRCGGGQEADPTGWSSPCKNIYSETQKGTGGFLSRHET